MPGLLDLFPFLSTPGGAVTSNPALMQQAESARTGQAKRAIGSIERNLSPQEMQIVNYHRKMVSSGGAGRDEQGRPVTVYSTTIKVPEGPLRGKFVTVPGYFGGQINEDEDAIYAQWADQIAAGLWPAYSHPVVADKRAKYLHRIMDLESN